MIFTDERSTSIVAQAIPPHFYSLDGACRESFSLLDLSRHKEKFEQGLLATAPPVDFTVDAILIICVFQITTDSKLV